MQMRKYVLAGYLAAMVLGGCATANPWEGVRPSWTLNEKDFAAITPGKSMVEVERALGRPLLAETFANLREVVWSYRFVDGGVRRFGAEVHFHDDGKVKYVVTYEDRCVMEPVACPN
jgi:outer membrane protein assembly factor BamE (lipoprotein component of BamABCDE complex)